MVEALSYVTLKPFIGKIHSANNCFEYDVTYFNRIVFLNNFTVTNLKNKFIS